MPKTPGEMIAAIAKNMKDKTGRSVEEWRTLLKKDGPKGDGKEQRGWLMKTYGLGRGQAGVIADVMSRSSYENPEQLIDSQYAQERAGLRPIYEALIQAAKQLGTDVVAKPCKTYVPIHRISTFALIKPGKDKVELGLVIPNIKATKRLELAGRFAHDRITHKVALRNLDEVDDELKAWLRLAYDRNGL